VYLPLCPSDSRLVAGSFIRHRAAVEHGGGTTPAAGEDVVSRNPRTDVAAVAGIGAMSIVIAVWGEPWPSIAAASIAATVAALWTGRRPKP